jgi:hypothetical protein
MLKMLQSVWMTAVIGALVFVGTLYLSWRKMPVPAAATTAPVEEDDEVKDHDYVLPKGIDLDVLVADLNRRKGEIETKERTLQEWERQLISMSNSLSEFKGRVDIILTNVEKDIVTIKEKDLAGLKKSSKLMEGMEPDSAANLLLAETSDTAAKYLSFMKDEKISGILEAMRKTGDAGAKRANELFRKVGTLTPSTPSTKKS